MNERVLVATKKPETKRENKVSQTLKSVPSQSISSPVEQILFLQRTIGNQAVGRLIKSEALQAKLKIGQPGDKYEQEADRVAEQVMRMPEPQAVSTNTPHTQRACPACEKDELRLELIKEEKKEDIKTKGTSGQSPQVTSEVENSINSMHGGGQPLPESLRAFYEPRFGQDFSGVRVHTDAKAAESARTVNARAFTVGRNVVFGAGEYTPGTSEGRRLVAHELTHVLQQTIGRTQSRIPGNTVYSNEHGDERISQPVKPHIHLKSTPAFILRSISSELRERIELCINPFYYDDKGRYSWFSPKPDCSDMKIPTDRERAWKCADKFYWSPDGQKWDWFGPEPNCSDLSLPVPLHEARAESPEEQNRRKEEERLRKIFEANRNRITAIRDESSSDVEALALMFTDAKIIDDGTIPGRVHAILDATAHPLIPGLQTGIKFKQSGFRKEFHDPWESSINQVGHFLTAVRLAFDPGVVTNNPIVLAILGAWRDKEIPLRLIIGHEKEPDPDIFEMSVGFKAQYRSTTEADIKNFKAGNLEAIKVGKGKGNSMADLLLSHKGWILGLWIAKGHFKKKEEIADWIRRTIGTLKQ
jgi:hypothetical protein